MPTVRTITGAVFVVLIPVTVWALAFVAVELRMSGSSVVLVLMLFVVPFLVFATLVKIMRDFVKALWGK